MSAPTAPKHALIVDDEPLVCNAVKMLLQVDGYEVETADSGDSALKIFAPGKFEIVLVDFEMPRMKGDQLANRLKEISPRQPVVMLTAHGELLRASGRSLAGVDVMVDKPFRLETLRQGMAKAVAKYAAPSSGTRPSA